MSPGSAHISAERPCLGYSKAALEAHCNKAETGVVGKARPLPGSHSRPTPLTRATKAAQDKTGLIADRKQAQKLTRPCAPSVFPLFFGK